MKASLLCLITIVGLSLAACGGKAKPATETTPATPATASQTKTCAQGEMLWENECYKECATDEDCPAGGVCQMFRVQEEDGRFGPVAGSGCLEQ
jgi:hypothetical protein